MRVPRGRIYIHKLLRLEKNFIAIFIKVHLANLVLNTVLLCVK